MLQHEHLVAQYCFETSENELSEVEIWTILMDWYRIKLVPTQAEGLRPVGVQDQRGGAFRREDGRAAEEKPAPKKALTLSQIGFSSTSNYLALARQLDTQLDSSLIRQLDARVRQA